MENGNITLVAMLSLQDITWRKTVFLKASSEEDDPPSPPPEAESKVDVKPNSTFEEAKMMEVEMDDDLNGISLSQEERRRSHGDPRTSEIAGVGIVQDEIGDLSDDDSDLVIDEPEEEIKRESEEEYFEEESPMEREETKPTLPTFNFLADQRALLQPKTELQRKPEPAIQLKSRVGLGVGLGGGVGGVVGGGDGGGVATQLRAPANIQAAASSPSSFTPYFNLDILATVASMNR